MNTSRILSLGLLTVGEEFFSHVDRLGPNSSYWGKSHNHGWTGFKISYLGSNTGYGITYEIHASAPILKHLTNTRYKSGMMHLMGSSKELKPQDPLPPEKDIGRIFFTLMHKVED